MIIIHNNQSIITHQSRTYKIDNTKLHAHTHPPTDPYTHKHTHTHTHIYMRTNKHTYTHAHTQSKYPYNQSNKFIRSKTRT